jgi:hypothetical protein
MKPCPPPEEGLTLPEAEGNRCKLMSLLNEATIEYLSGETILGEDGGAKNSLCTIRFKNGSEAKVHHESHWQEGLGGHKIELTYKFNKQRTIELVYGYGDNHAVEQFFRELSVKEYCKIKKDLGLNDETSMSEFLAAVVSRSMPIEDFLFVGGGVFDEEHEHEHAPHFLQAKRLLPPSVEHDSEMIIYVQSPDKRMEGYVECGAKKHLRVKPTTRLSSIAAKYVEIVGKETVNDLDFYIRGVKVTGDPTVEEMKLEDACGISWKNK